LHTFIQRESIGPAPTNRKLLRTVDRG
jgi:hypothetical protein